MSTDMWVWSDLHDKAVENFKAFFPSNDELVIKRAFENNPEATDKALDDVIGRFKSGAIHKPFLIWRKSCEQTADNVAIPKRDNREKRVLLAESWMRSAGLYYDRWEHIESELFDEGDGRLKEFRDDPALVHRMRACWDKERPRGEKLETRSDEHFVAIKESWATVAEAKRDRRRELTKERV